MGRRIRMYSSDEYYFVTARTFQSRLLLRPSAQLNQVLGGVLARACRLTGVQLYGFVAASNHVHFLCRARDGVLSRFMQYFLGNVSKKVGKLVRWRGQLWERRFSAQPVLDDAAMEHRLKYILAHGVKEGLVRKASEWPGLSCLAQLVGAGARAFPHFEWTRRWKSGRLASKGDDPWSMELATLERLEVHPLPSWEGLSVEGREHRVREMVAELEAEARPLFERVLGVRKILMSDPHSEPHETKRSPAPWCHTAIHHLKEDFKARYCAFEQTFKEAAARCRVDQGKLRFPLLAFRPALQIK